MGDSGIMNNYPIILLISQRITILLLGKHLSFNFKFHFKVYISYVFFVCTKCPHPSDGNVKKVFFMV